MPLFRRAIPLLLAAALARAAAAGVVSAPAGAVFSAPPAAWAAPLGAAFADPAVTPLLPPGLSPSLSSPESLRAAAPLTASLTKALSVSPQAFAAMPAAERRAAVELAVEDAREAVRAKAYELEENARALAKPGRAMDKEARAELYAAVARLMEMREHYGPWLDEDGKAAVSHGYELASAKAWEVRTSLLQDDAAPAPNNSHNFKPDTQKEARYVLSPPGTAVKLRADMENNKNGWGQDDLDTLYAGYGFVLRQGGKHRMYYHPRYPQLHETVSRQNDLPPGYAHSALKLIRELERLTAQEGRTEAAPPTGPPAALALSDLSILLSQPKQKAPKPEPVAAKDRARPPPTAKRPRPATVAARLAPAAPRAAVAAPKPEPPAAPVPLVKPAGFIERIRNFWAKLKDS